MTEREEALRLEYLRTVKELIEAIQEFKVAVRELMEVISNYNERLKP